MTAFRLLATIEYEEQEQGSILLSASGVAYHQIRWTAAILPNVQLLATTD